MQCPLSRLSEAPSSQEFALNSVAIPPAVRALNPSVASRRFGEGAMNCSESPGNGTQGSPSLHWCRLPDRIGMDTGSACMAAALNTGLLGWKRRHSQPVASSVSQTPIWSSKRRFEIEIQSEI
jgi:hypothetical protein